MRQTEQPDANSSSKMAAPFQPYRLISDYFQPLPSDAPLPASARISTSPTKRKSDDMIVVNVAGRVTNTSHHATAPGKRNRADTPEDFIPISSDNESEPGDGNKCKKRRVGLRSFEIDDDEPPLCEEQQRIVDLATTGCNIFYTGSAGCGKTRVLKTIKAALKAQGKEVRVMAPTGKAALAVEGTTTWSFAGLRPEDNKKTMAALRSYAAGNKYVRKRFHRTDTIIIDEVSMVENLHLERINQVMQAGRFDDRPFGGVQVILTGDFCQLPPVKPFQHCAHCGNPFQEEYQDSQVIYQCNICDRRYYQSDKWAFRSAVWDQCQFQHINLNTIHRQKDHQFKSMLQKCRMGIPFSKHEIHVLMNHQSNTHNAVKLFPTREEVSRTNDEAFARLPGSPLHYTCYDAFLGADHLKSKYGTKSPDGSLSHLGDNHRFSRDLDLKIGMQVVLLTNLNLHAGLCNGSQGIIVDFEPYNSAKLPRKSPNGTPASGLIGEHASLREHHISRFASRQHPPPPSPSIHPGWPIVHFFNLPTSSGQSGKCTRTIYPDCFVTDVSEPESGQALVCRTQVPLVAAWALTTHRVQGMTLGRVIVDLTRAFEEGQVYVALSRATSLEGLKVEGDARALSAWGGNEEVREWLGGKFPELRGVS